jgi:predicted ATPase
MKIRSVYLQRYKQFTDHTIRFIDDDGMIPDIVLLIGDNGSGKTSILQAIAATLATATQQLDKPGSLKWSGFEENSISASHRGYTKIELDMLFSQDEILATRQFYHESDYATLNNTKEPGTEQAIKLIWDQSPGATYPVSTLPRGSEYFFQFQGRRYAYNLLYNRKSIPGMFEKIGGVFWYTEQRTSYSLAPFISEGADENGKYAISQANDEASIRRLITRWFASRSEKSDKVAKFNQLYKRLFPERSLIRIEDTYGRSDPPVFFFDGRYEYDISELSGGERALMPLLLDFVEWGIHNSVILIDELELHLHPPLQQALLTLLPKLGHDNQFIISTHSNAVANLVPDEHIKRVSINEQYH